MLYSSKIGGKSTWNREAAHRKLACLEGRKGEESEKEE